MANTVFGLIDCNNFYCSCERVFAPHLNNRPVIVLSNNDGCVIARCEQVKALGIPMGTPAFKIRDLIRQHNIEVCSSNYALYADMSRRVQLVVADYIPEHQIYSIDEIFLDLTHDAEPHKTCVELRKRVQQLTGIPTSIGIGPTKTLAKLANLHAKKNARFDGVCDVSEPYLRERLLQQTPVRQVWGIGRSLEALCHQYGAQNAHQIAQLDIQTCRKASNVGLEKSIRELGGTACYSIDTIPPHPKSCAVTRSFKRPITQFSDILEAIASYATRAAQKCRQHGQVAQAIQVFISTSPHREKFYSASLCAQLSPPNADTRLLLKAARTLAKSCWKEGFSYKKAGVILLDLTTMEQGALNFSGHDTVKSKQLMTTLDEINQRHGRGSLFFGAQGSATLNLTDRAHCSPSYTTKLDEVPIVKAK